MSFCHMGLHKDLIWCGKKFTDLNRSQAVHYKPEQYFCVIVQDEYRADKDGADDQTHKNIIIN